MSYNGHYAEWALECALSYWRFAGSPNWTKAERFDFIATMRMGGEL